MTKDNAEDRVVTIKRVTKFWSTNNDGTVLAGLSSNVYVTQRSFDMLQNPPKVPYTVKEVTYGYYDPNVSPSGFELYRNPIITKIDLNNVETINSFAFYYSQNLVTVVADKVKYIYDGAFAGTKIKRINLPEIERISGHGSYYYTFPTTLQSITIGTKVKSLGDYLFLKELREVRIASNTPGAITMQNQVIQEGNNTTLYVPSAYVNDWKLKFPWVEQTFKGGIKGM